MKQVATIADRIKEYRDTHDLSLAEMAKLTGVSPQALNKYELRQRVPKIDVANKIAEALDISPLWLNGYDEPMRITKLPPNAIPFNETRYAPIVGSIPAGVPALAIEDIQGYLTIPYNDGEEYFFLRVSGDSMIGAGINSGDLVLIRKQKCADDGQIVACRVNGDEATLKRYKRQGDTVLLLPENPQYDPRIVSVSDFDRGYAEIIGVALEIRKQL